MTKRITFGEDDLFKKLHPILLDIFSRGVLAGKTKPLLTGALLSIATSPVVWATLVFKRGIHLIILFSTYWLLQDKIARLGIPGEFFITIGLIAIFYKDLYNEMFQFILYILIILTGGGFLRWICQGYLKGTGFRQYWLTLTPFSKMVGTMVHVIERTHRGHYEKLMDLYLESDTSGSEDELNRLIIEYKGEG